MLSDAVCPHKARRDNASAGSQSNAQRRAGCVTAAGSEVGQRQLRVYRRLATGSEKA